METEKQAESTIDASSFNVAIVTGMFHPQLALELLENSIAELMRNGVKRENIKVIKVAGALELPYICRRIINFRKIDIIVALGIVIRGETTHYELVTETTFKGLMDVQIAAARCPIAFGILACENVEQAKQRISKDGYNLGKRAVQAVLLQEHIVKTQL